MNGWFAAIEKHGEDERKKRIEIIARFNNLHRPRIEWDDIMPQGLFFIDGNYFIGTKYSNGYHPEELRIIPEPVVRYLEDK